MIEQELFKKHFLGRDGFVWWVGQIADAKMWKTNQPGRRTLSNSDHKGFAERYRVRIMGYHTADSKALPDNDLPWATVMYPVTAGSGGATASESTQLRQGSFVFGFFMDGEDGQVPVIMGVLGYNEYTAVMRNVPPVPFLPFDGYEKLDRRAQYAIKEKKEKVPGTQVKSPGTTGGGAPEKTLTPGEPLPKPTPAGNTQDPQPKIVNSGNNQNQAFCIAQDPSMKKDGEIPTPEAKLRRDGPNQIKGLQIDIRNLVQKIELITRDLSKFGTEQKGLINKYSEKIQKAMDEATKFVSEKVKWIVKELRKNTVERVNNAVKDTFYLFFPNERPKVKKAKDKAMSKISCVFDKVVKGLFGLVGKFLGSLVSKIVNVAACVIENFVGGLVGKIAGFLSGALDNILKPLNSLLGIVSSIGAIGSSLGGFKGFKIDAVANIFESVKSLRGFFSCETKPASQVTDQWSVWGGAGDNGESLAKLKSVFDKAKAVGSQAVDAANQVTGVVGQVTGAVGQVTGVVGQVTGAVGQVTSLGDSIGSALKSLDFSDLFQDTCNVGAILCGPPTVSFFGGGGIGAAANAVVSASGDILGVDIVNPGSGYVDTPFISFNDACGKGRGAVAKVVLNNFNKGGTGVGLGLDSTLINVPLQNNFWSGDQNLSLFDQSSNPIDLDPTVGTGGDTAAGAAGAGTGGTASGGANNDNVIGVPIEISLVSPGTEYEFSSNVSTSGGSGNGLTVNIETDDNIDLNDDDAEDIGGSVVSISIYDPGTGYKVGDVITIDGGLGGTFRVDKVEGPASSVSANSQIPSAGGIAKVIIIDSGAGYLPAPDGDSGGEGRIWKTKDQTEVRRSTLDYDRPYDPGQIINLNPGDTVTLPVGSSETISDTNGNVIEIIPGGFAYTVLNSGTITAPVGIQTSITSEFPTLSNGQYPVVLELEEVYVKSSGFDYSPEDKIVMEPNLGAVLEPIFNSVGALLGVNIVKGAEGFTEMPEIFIETETGYNAEMVPIFKVNRVGDNMDNLDPALGEKVISVINCVGKF